MASQALRQSVTVPADKAKKIRQYAKKHKLTMSKALVELANRGLRAEYVEQLEFDRLARIVNESNDSKVRDKAIEALVKLTLGT